MRSRRRAQQPSGTCPELPSEVWSMIMRQCGNHLEGFLSQLRILATQKSDGAMLPHVGETCTVDLSTLTRLTECKRRDSFDVYDVSSGRIVSVSGHSFVRGKRIHDEFKTLPKSIRHYPAGGLLYWWPYTESKRQSPVRLAVPEIDFNDQEAFDRLEKITRKTLDKFKLSAEDVVAASTESLQGLFLRGSNLAVAEDYQAALDSIARALVASANDHIKHLHLDLDVPWNDNDMNVSIDVSPLVGGVKDKLTRLTLVLNTRSTFGVKTLVQHADRIVMLSLSPSESSFLCPDFELEWELAKLFVRWRKNPVDELRGVHYGWMMPEFTLLNAFCLANMSDGTLLSKTTLNEIYHGVVTDKFWLTSTMYSSRIPRHAIRFSNWFSDFIADELASDDSLEFEDMVDRCMYEMQPRLVEGADMGQHANVRVKVLAKEADVPEVVSNDGGVQAVEQYTDAKRERDRYMWQWFPYTCNSCGVVWQPNCVTVSWRQSAVSACLHNKRKCMTRPEYTKMMNGETFLLTKAHDLTPDPSKVVEAAADGLVVAIDPTTKDYQFFRPDGTSKVPV